MNIKETIIEVSLSILPLTMVVLIMQFFLLDFTFEFFFVFIIGVLISIIGFSLFIIGAKLSLLEIGEIIGRKLITKAKLWFVIFFGVALGFAVTLAEPGVQVLSDQVDMLDNSGGSKWILVITISLGVGIFLALALFRYIFNISLKKILIFSYLSIFIVGIFSSPQFFSIAFDAGGVTTGPMAVPFILALGFGVSSLNRITKATHERFGFIALASIGPILAVLIMGVFIR